MTRAAPATIVAIAVRSGTRQATPSTKVSADAVVTTSPAANDSALGRRRLRHDADDLGVAGRAGRARRSGRRCRCPCRPAHRRCRCRRPPRTARAHRWRRRARGRGETAAPARGRARPRARRRARARPGSRARPRPRVAPKPRIAAFLSGLLPCGTRIVTGRPGGAPRERQALPVVAARRRDDARHLRALAPQAVDVDQPAADLEGAGRRVVLVLDPDLGAERLREQRPGVLRRRRHAAVHELARVVEIGARERHRRSDYRAPMSAISPQICSAADEGSIRARSRWSPAPRAGSVPRRPPASSAEGASVVLADRDGDRAAALAESLGGPDARARGWTSPARRTSRRRSSAPSSASGASTCII